MHVLSYFASCCKYFYNCIFNLIVDFRFARLGIGATLPEESKIIRSNNPVERKLFANLNASKRKASARDEHLEPSTKDEKVDEESDEDETESKAKAFTKKNPPSLTSSLHAKKKKKRG